MEPVNYSVRIPGRITINRHILLVQPIGFIYSGPGFDSSAYLNPTDYGYRLELLSSKTQFLNANGDSVFRPVTFKGGLEKLQGQTESPKNQAPAMRETVVLEVYVDSTSKITNVKVIRSPYDFLTKKAIRIVMKSEPENACLNGQPVHSFIRILLEFDLYKVKTVRKTNRY